MFFPTDAPAQRYCAELRALRFSMNAPVVALEGLPVGPARAAVALHPGPEPRVTVALRSTRSGQMLFYCAGDELAELSSGGVVMDAALSFAESMGFLFDDDEVEIRGGEGPAQCARLWSEFIDESPERPPERPKRAPAPAPAPRPPAAAAPAQRKPAARSAPDALDVLPATIPDEFLSVDLPTAPLAMLEDDEPGDALPFWLLQPEPPRRAPARPAQEPAPPEKPAESPEPWLGLARKPTTPAQSRTRVARPHEEPEGPPRFQEEPQPFLEEPPSVQVQEEPPRFLRRESHGRAAAAGTRRGVRPEREARAQGEAPVALRAVIAETGVDRLLASSKPSPPAEERGPGLSKFRLRPQPDSPAARSESESEAETPEQRDFESLSLRLRSRF